MNTSAACLLFKIVFYFIFHAYFPPFLFHFPRKMHFFILYTVAAVQHGISSHTKQFHLQISDCLEKQVNTARLLRSCLLTKTVCWTNCLFFPRKACTYCLVSFGLFLSALSLLFFLLIGKKVFKTLQLFLIYLAKFH